MNNKSFSVANLNKDEKKLFRNLNSFNKAL